jgi:hypothetical protein
MTGESAELPVAWLPKEKPCSGCSRWLPLDAFPVNRRMHFGRSSRCRECAREATRDWRRRNRERENADRRAAYRKANPLPERACVVCGRLFLKRPDALVCGARCRERRKAGQRRKRATGCGGRPGGPRAGLRDFSARDTG